MLTGVARQGFMTTRTGWLPRRALIIGQLIGQTTAVQHWKVLIMIKTECLPRRVLVKPHLIGQTGVQFRNVLMTVYAILTSAKGAGGYVKALCTIVGAPKVR
jgi:hypothetical protein